MILKTEKKEITIIPKIKHIIELTYSLKGKNLNEIFFKGSSNNDLNVLCKVIFSFAMSEDKRAFAKEEEVYEFLDDYITETGKTIADIYKEIAEEINKMGFFNKKMSDEELNSSLNSNLEIDMDSIVTDIVKKVSEERMKPEIEKQFKGFKA